MAKTKFVGFRATEQQENKLQYLADALGTNPSAILRELVENAELKPIKISPVANLTVKNNRHDAKVSSAQSITAVEA